MSSRKDLIMLFECILCQDELTPFFSGLPGFLNFFLSPGIPPHFLRRYIVPPPFFFQRFPITLHTPTLSIASHCCSGHFFVYILPFALLFSSFSVYICMSFEPLLHLGYGEGIRGAWPRFCVFSARRRGEGAQCPCDLAFIHLLDSWICLHEYLVLHRLLP